jgi:hypothetical protein
MIWEDLKVYKPLKKEDLESAFRDLTKILGQNLKEYGFKKQDRKLYRLSNDILEVIDFDYRGSWTGQNEVFDTNIGLIPLCWPNLIKDYYLIASKEIKEIDPKIKNHYRICKEYDLLADYLTKRIIKTVLPYFEKYNSTAKIVKNSGDFKYKTKSGGKDIFKSNFLILFSELKQHKNKKAIKILDNEIDYLTHLMTNSPDSKSQIHIEIELDKWKKIKQQVINKNWIDLDLAFKQTESEEIGRLKIKPVANTKPSS